MICVTKRWLAACICLCVLSTVSFFVAHAEGPTQAAPLTRVEIRDWLRKNRWPKARVQVSEIFGEVADGYHPAIGFREEDLSKKELAAAKAEWGNTAWDYTTKKRALFVCLIRRGPDRSIEVAGIEDIPTSSNPDSEFKWGVTQLKDVDGDGRAELLVTYAYESYAPGSTYGSIFHKEVSWLAFFEAKPTRIQGHLVLRRGYDTTLEFEWSYRYVQQAGTPFFDLETRFVKGDDVPLSPEGKAKLYRYDPASDTWVDPKTK